MSPALEKQIADTLGAAQQTGSEALSFIKERAPILAEQIIQYELLSNLTYLALVAACLVACAFLFKFSWKHERSAWKSNDFYVCPIGVWLVIPALISVASLPFALIDLVKVLTAPDLVVLEYISKFVR